MDRYRINCAIVFPAAAGLIGIGVGMTVKTLNLTPVLTPMLMEQLAWWPSDVLYSGVLIGGAFGVVGAAIAIAADIARVNMRRGILETQGAR